MGICAAFRQAGRTITRLVPRDQTSSIEGDAVQSALREESRRLDALAGVLFQTGIGAMLGGLALAGALTRISDVERAGLALVSFIAGALGLLAGLTLLRVEDDSNMTTSDVAARRTELNNYLFGFVFVVVFTAGIKIIVLAVP
jgi:hypothetical protein